MPLEEWDITILGDPDAGAFELATQGYDHTIDDEPLRKHIVVDEQACIIEPNHMQGAEQFTSLRDYYIRHAQGFVLAFSLTSRASFEHVKSYHDSVRITKGRNPGPISIIIGNHRDRYQDREVPLEEGRELARRLGCNYFEVSVRHTESMERAFSELVRQLRRGGVGVGSPRRKAKGRRRRTCLVM